AMRTLGGMVDLRCERSSSPGGVGPSASLIVPNLGGPARAARKTAGRPAFSGHARRTRPPRARMRPARAGAPAVCSLRREAGRDQLRHGEGLLEPCNDAGLRSGVMRIERDSDVEPEHAPLDLRKRDPKTAADAPAQPEVRRITEGVPYVVEGDGA